VQYDGTFESIAVGGVKSMQFVVDIDAHFAVGTIADTIFPQRRAMAVYFIRKYGFAVCAFLSVAMSAKTFAKNFTRL
jgi:predicted Kef-type K+ transport protein